MPVDFGVDKIGSGIKIRMALMASWFSDLSHVEMIEQVAAYGFSAVEDLGAGKWEDREAVGRKCAELGVEMGTISCGGTIREDGPVNPEYHPTFLTTVKAAIEAAKQLGSKNILALAGAQRSDMTMEQQMQNLVTAGKMVAPYLEDAGITMSFELLNTKVNHAGYPLVYTPQGVELVRAVGSPNVKMLFDIYHQQISEGDVIRNITDYIAEIGHFHFADNPGRHEPGTGELCYKQIFKAIDKAGYKGLVSAEFGKTPELTVPELLKILAECATW